MVKSYEDAMMQINGIIGDRFQALSLEQMEACIADIRELGNADKTYFDNARLLALAPEMLVVLRALWDSNAIDQDDKGNLILGNQKDIRKVINLLMDVLEKARGL